MSLFISLKSNIFVLKIRSFFNTKILLILVNLKMKILILNYEFPPLGGGAGNATKYILKEFSHIKDLEIDLVTSSVEKFKLEQFSSNIRIHYLDIGKNPKKLHFQSIKDLLIYSKKAYSYIKKNLMKKNSYDLCHAFFGIPCGFIAKKLDIPYIVSLRGSDVPFYNIKYKYLDKFFFKNLSKGIWADAKAVIANSSGLKDLALASIPNQEIGIIFNGIDTNEFIPKKDYNLDGKLKILSVGRLIERKGFKYLIEAIKDLDNVSLSIIGDGPDLEYLKELSNGLDINFLGLIEHDDLGKLYKDYDLFILASLNEGMSNTVLEAMSAGLPLILSDTGGTRELIKDHGFVVPTHNSEEIHKAITKYLNNPKLLEVYGRESREKALQMNWKSVSKQYLKEYKKAIGDE